jgi:hypothetical protein
MGNWTLQVNVAGVQPFEPGGKRLPEGAYAVVIKDSDMKQSDPSKPASLGFKFAVAEEGEFKGVEGMVFVSTDFSKDFHKKHMRALLLGMGAKPEALDNGTLNLDASLFAGKTAYIFVETRDGEVEVDGKKVKQYDNRNFIAPAYYEKWKAENKGAKAQPAPAGANGAASGGGLGSLAGAGAASPSPFGGGAIFGK